MDSELPAYSKHDPHGPRRSLSPRGPAPVMPTFSSDSSVLIKSPLLTHEPVRSSYLSLRPSQTPAPVISTSPFVPTKMIEHLMRNKKSRAIAVKFSPHGQRDNITNMEGAMHTFVMPLVPIYMHGDYAYRGYHEVSAFKPDCGHQQARVVVLSAMVHPDFEDESVMYKLAALEKEAVPGRDLGEDFIIISREEKQNEKIRLAYEDRLKRHMIKHLTANGNLPSQDAVKSMSSHKAIEFLTNGGSPVGCYVALSSHSRTVRPNKERPQCTVLSLEVLFHSAVQQVVNEFSALEALCTNGYVYTFDPPAIFAQTLGPTLINRLYIAAVAHVVTLNPRGFQNMRVFAFNDYADPQAPKLLQRAFKSQPHISVVSKASLFPAPGWYSPPLSAKTAILVLHNNSDAFGQNIETEGDGGSMDGAIGCHSSAAASLHRQNPQLLDQILDPSQKLRSR